MWGIDGQDLMYQKLLRDRKPYKPPAPRRRGKTARRRRVVADAGNRQTLRLSVDVYDEAIVLSRYGEPNVERRLIEPAAAAKLFAANDGAGKARSSGRVELRPDRTAWRTWLDADRRQHLLTIVPAKRRTITVRLAGRSHRYRLNVPRLLVEMVYAWRDGRGAWNQVAFVGAFAGRLGDGTRLHVPPLPDCDRFGHVCMGNAKLGGRLYADLDARPAFERAFLGTRFADHWLDQCLVENSGYRNLLDAVTRRRGRIGLDLLSPLGTYGKLYGPDADDQGQEDGFDRDDGEDEDDE